MVSDDDMKRLADRIADRSAVLDVGVHQLLTDLRQFDAAQGWKKVGQLSCAHWLSWRCGVALPAGREKVRVAHALAKLLKTDDALRSGQLSYSKARAITRVATPDTEEKLVELAQVSSAAHLERLCRLHAQQLEEKLNEPERWFRVRETSRGMVRVAVQLHPEEASRLVEAIDAVAKNRVDGILAMAEAALRGDCPERPPTDIIVHIDAGTLTGQQEDAGLPPETCRRLLCDSAITVVLEDSDGNPVEVGPKTCRFSAAFRRALFARDGGCRFPGCTNRKFLDGHPIRHWIEGGKTTLENTLLLCTAHHKLVHEGGYRIVAEENEVRFVSPEGVELGPAGERTTPVEALATVAGIASFVGHERAAVGGLFG